MLPRLLRQKLRLGRRIRISCHSMPQNRPGRWLEGLRPPGGSLLHIAIGDLGFWEIAEPQSREWQRPLLLHPASLGTIDKDPQDPCLEGRTPLKRPHSLDDADPGVLDHLIRGSGVGDVKPGDAAQRGMMLVHEARERLFVTLAQRLDECQIRFRCDAVPGRHHSIAPGVAGSRPLAVLAHAGLPRAVTDTNRKKIAHCNDSPLPGTNRWMPASTRLSWEMDSRYQGDDE